MFTRGSAAACDYVPCTTDLSEMDIRPLKPKRLLQGSARFRSRPRSRDSQCQSPIRKTGDRLPAIKPLLVDARCPMPVASALLHHTPSRKGGAIAIRSLPRRSPGPERISGKAGPICPQLRKCHGRPGSYAWCTQADMPLQTRWSEVGP